MNNLKKRYTKHQEAQHQQMYNLIMTDVYKKIITAVNIQTGDDGTKAHKVLETFHELLKMDKEQYKKQQRYFG
tara:strand:+ start:222 stop:440 length:219 start_codon:yes stop_codon:yes gene_type:complete